MTESLALGASAPSTAAGDQPTGPFVLSLVGGLLILSGAGTMSMFTAFGAPHFGMMGGFYGMMQWFGYGGWFYAAVVVGVVSGIGAVVGSLMMYSRPAKTHVWGVLVLVFSLISFFGMGGFFFGGLLGVVGGILAIIWRPMGAPAGHGP